MIYYGYKLKADGTFEYDIRHDIVPSGAFCGRVMLGRRYYTDEHVMGSYGPTVMIFYPYVTLGLFELMLDLPKIIGYQSQFYAFKFYNRGQRWMQRLIGWGRP